jgi:hypothetical protein
METYLIHVKQVVYRANDDEIMGKKLLSYCITKQKYRPNNKKKSLQNEKRVALPAPWVIL